MINSTLGTHQKSLGYHDSNLDLRRKILYVVSLMHEYDLEDLLHDLLPYTWNQVFLEVDRMSRTGELRLLYRGPGLYTVCLPLPTPQHILKEQVMVSV